MKKRYLTPTIDFEVLEEDDMLMTSGNSEFVVGADGTGTNQESGDIGTVDDDDIGGDDGWELL